MPRIKETACLAEIDCCTDTIRVCIVRIGGADYLDVRRHVRFEGSWIPQSKGIVLGLGDIDTVAEALHAGKKQILESRR